MRISMTTGRISEHVGDLKAIEIIGAAGFDCADMSLHTITGEAWPWPYQDCIAHAKEIRKQCKAVNIAVGQAHLPFVFRWAETVSFQQHAIPSLKCMLEAASVIESPCVVLHPVHYLPYGVYEKLMTEQTRILCDELLPVAERLGIKIALDNMFAYNNEGLPACDMFGEPEKLKAFLAEYHHPSLVACVDTGHAQLVGTAPGEMIRCLGTAVQVLHLHDNNGLRDQHMPPYFGVIDWKDTIQALKEIHYTGDLCFEVLKNYYGRFETQQLLIAAAAFIANLGRIMAAEFKRN